MIYSSNSPSSPSLSPVHPMSNPEFLQGKSTVMTVLATRLTSKLANLFNEKVPDPVLMANYIVAMLFSNATYVSNLFELVHGLVPSFPAWTVGQWVSIDRSKMDLGSSVGATYRNKAYVHPLSYQILEVNYVDLSITLGLPAEYSAPHVKMTLLADSPHICAVDGWIGWSDEQQETPVESH